MGYIITAYETISLISGTQIFSDNAIDLLNAPITKHHIIIGLSAIAVWFVLWHLLLKKILAKCKVGTVWYGLYELGWMGILAVLLFISIMVILFIGSVQAVSDYGISLLFALILFWGGFLTAIILVVKHIRKH